MGENGGWSSRRSQQRRQPEGVKFGGEYVIPPPLAKEDYGFDTSNYHFNHMAGDDLLSQPPPYAAGTAWSHSHQPDDLQGTRMLFGSTNESPAFIPNTVSPRTTNKPACVCLCHDSTLELLQWNQPVGVQMAHQIPPQLGVDHQFGRQPLATIGADGLATPISMPTKIPENPTTKELFELMCNTQALLMGFQHSTDVRLDSLETKASTNIDKLTTISLIVEANKSNIAVSTGKLEGIEGSTKELRSDLGSAIERIAELEKGLNQLDRNVRNYNLRFFEVREDADENCILKVATAIKNNLYCTPQMPLDEVVKSIEGAYRLGKEKVGQHRPILVRFYAKNMRDNVVQACKKKGGKSVEGYSITDDRTQPDRAIHARNVPYMKQWYDLDGTKIFYKHSNFRVRGVWYTEAEFKREFNKLPVHRGARP